MKFSITDMIIFEIHSIVTILKMVKKCIHLFRYSKRRKSIESTFYSTSTTLGKIFILPNSDPIIMHNNYNSAYTWHQSIWIDMLRYCINPYVT